MHSVFAAAIVAALAFLGTMYDNYFAFAAQLVVTPPEKVRSVSQAQALGIGVLVVFSLAVGKGLGFVPLRLVGLTCIAPWGLGLHAWRHRHDEQHAVYKRGALTTFVMSFALGGDNLAVWAPLFRADSALKIATDAVVFLLLEALFIGSALRLTRFPKALAWGAKTGRYLIPWVYLFLGVLILVECGTL